VPGLKVDLSLRRVWASGEEVHLTPIQYKILAALVRSAGKVVTHQQLLREAWGEETVAGSESVRLFVHQLRHKLEPNPVRPKYLRTEPGVGYRLLAEEE
jgi:two-component system KDP operon response regulator KdpE